MTTSNSWQRFCEYYTYDNNTCISLDISRMDFPSSFIASMEPQAEKAFKAMASLEAGEIANPDENRMVGHYWLRKPELAPSEEIKKAITETLTSIQSFVSQIHNQTITAPGGKAFKNLLLIGIGGSALGPQLVAQALGGNKDKLRPYFCDNTDPDGFDRIVEELGEELGQTLAIVISKSGGTPETRNGMLEIRKRYEAKGLDFSKHALAITGVDSKLDKLAKQEAWLAQFPIWDWVGGRTSICSAVGLVPMALQGIDIKNFLAGAEAMDESTRSSNLQTNMAMRLAMMWHFAGNGKGEKDMVVLPYKDRLVLFSKYLQQLVMESLGKEKDLAGKVVHQGIAVYGNKGSTDQHAYIQQLRDGLNNFFAVFIEVLNDRVATTSQALENELMVEPDATSGDFLSGFFQGTRKALHENKRESLTLTIRELTPFSLGSLIALFERAVGFYASLVNVNAYHQPGVEAGKKAAAAVLEQQRAILYFLRDNAGSEHGAEQIAAATGNPNDAETVFKILEHLSENNAHGVRRSGEPLPQSATYSIKN